MSKLNQIHIIGKKNNPNNFQITSTLPDTKLRMAYNDKNEVFQTSLKLRQKPLPNYKPFPKE